MASIYGQIVTGAHVERAARAHLRRWSDDYLAEVADQYGWARGELAPFRSYVAGIDLDAFAEDQTPTAVTVVPNTLTVPERQADGTYRVTYPLTVGIVVSGQSRDNTFELGWLYVGAVRSLFLQQRSIGGEDWVDGVSWLGESVDELDSDDARSLIMGAASFAVTVHAAIDTLAGPTQPSADPAVPPGGWGTVQAVGIEVREV